MRARARSTSASTSVVASTANGSSMISSRPRARRGVKIGRMTAPVSRARRAGPGGSVVSRPKKTTGRPLRKKSRSDSMATIPPRLSRPITRRMPPGVAGSIGIPRLCRRYPTAVSMNSGTVRVTTPVTS